MTRLSFRDSPRDTVPTSKVIKPHLSAKDGARSASNLSFPKAKFVRDEPVPGSTKELIGSWPTADYDYYLEFDEGLAKVYRAPRAPLDNGNTTTDSRLNPQIVAMNNRNQQRR